MRAQPFDRLIGEKIVRVKHGSPHTPTCGSYGAMTLHTESGKEFVVWQAYGEVNLSLVEAIDRAHLAEAKQL